MSIKCVKLGQIYDPRFQSHHPKLLTHASNPVPVLLSGDIFRIFYSARDSMNRSSVGALDFNLVEKKIVNIHKKPIVIHGDQTSFFSAGISLGNYYEFNNKKAISFMGWRTMDDGTWRGEIGSFSLTQDLFLDEISTQPMIKIDKEIDTISLSYPWILETAPDQLVAWYGSTIGRDKSNNEMIHVINQAYSSDASSWKKIGLALPYEKQKQQMFSRPCVFLNKSGVYEMWFSVRPGGGETYRIRHAESDDAKSWIHAKTPAKLDVSNAGWDSEMIEYPYVFSHKTNKYMLYNGNDFGKTGFGLAQLVHE